MTPRSDDTVAVVGTACRLPGGIHHLDDLWAVLTAGADLVGEVPPDRFPTADFVDTHRRPGQSYTAAGGFLNDVAGFDTTYFTGISPREAAQMDPQQRLLLEMAVEVLDDAGADAARLEGSDTAVFIGCSSRDYGELQAMSPESGDAYTMSGTAGAIVANRLSHYFDWHGQSATVDTACSSALTAVHQACEHLRNGHARVAVAGGINVLLNPHLYAGFCNASMLSPTGRCRPFSAEADGFARAEGGGLVLLKRLADARADGDHVHAVILSSGTNNDGRTPGLALPSSVAQQALLRQVYARARLVPDDVAYLEAHGTGTRAGDPLEVEAIGRALGVGRHRGPLPIGSVKSNLGHMEAAAGMAGLFKAMLVLRHQRIPATLHAERLNPDIAFDELNVRPVARPEPLDSPGMAVAGVNSFGFGGANAHVVIAAASAASVDELPPGPSSATALPLVVSARTPAALKRACEQMAEHLQFTEDGLYDIAYTATLRRTRHEHAACVWAADPSQAADALLRLAGGEATRAVTTAVRAAPGRVAFVFDGNGSQWAGMGADLMTDPVFAAAVDEVDTCLRPHLRWSVAERLAGGSPDLERTEVAQPLLFAVQVGLVRLMEAAGIEPDAVVGHSVGEIAAAYVAGCLDLEEACRVVAVRSRAQAATAGSGRMAAVGLGADAATKELAAFDGRLELAGVNSPTDVTLAGDPAALTELGRQLTARGVFFRLLDLDYAFHSRHMDPVHGDVTGPLSTLRPRPGRLGFASTVTGAVLAGPRLDAGYWWRNVREPVLFADAVRALVDEGCTSFVEVGPHPVLATYLKRLLPARAGAHATLHRDTDGPTAVRRAAAAVIAAGTRPGARCFPRPGAVVSLPGYPWQRERHWNGTPDWWASVPQDRTVVHPLLGRRAAVAEPTWHQQLTGSRLPWLADHQVGMDVVMPATAYLEAALAAGRAGLGARCEVTDLTVLRPLTLPRADDPTPLSLQTSLSVEDGIVLIASRRDASAPWTPHARGRVRRHTAPAPAPISAAEGGTVVDAAVHYEHTARARLHYGPAFRVLTTLRVSDSWVTADYELPAAAAKDGDGFEAHPVISDGALQTTAPLLAPVADGRVFLPTAVEKARVWHQPPARGRIHVRLRHLTGSDAVVDVTVSLEDGTVAAELSGCRLRALTAKDGLQELATVLRHAPLPGGWPVRSTAVPLPGPETSAAATAAARAAFEADQADDYPRFAALAKTTAGHYAAAAFAALLPGTSSFSLGDLLDAGLRPHYAPYARLLAGLAAKAGLLQPTSGGERWDFTGVPAAAESHMRRWSERCPQWITAIALAARYGTHLTDILTGRTDAREVLFNEADRHLVEAFYADTPQMRAHGHYVRLVIEEALRTWPTGRPLRVLEVGAGTGGLTTALLPVLPPHLTSYTFTDVTPAFFPRAQARFADHDYLDYLDYRTLDLNRDPAEQGFVPGSYDLIVAANVLHATADLRATCTRLARLLDSGGQLLAVESHDEEIIGPCFGLLPEYWSFTDDQVRTSPLLPRAAWPPLLSDCGFDAVADVGSEQPETAQDYCLLIARRSTAPGARPHPAPPALETPTRTEGPWLVVTDAAGQSLAGTLADDLRAAGAHVTGTRVPDAWDRGLGDFTDQVPSRVVLLFGTEQEQADADLVTEAAGVVKATASALAAAGHADPQLWLVTPPTGLHPAPADTGGLPWAAALWGVGRVVANEHPILTVRRVSLSSSGDLAHDAARLTAELLAPARSGAPGEEDETVLETHGRFVPRLRPLAPAARQAGRHDTYRLRLHRAGRGQQLTWAAAEAEEPGPGEVILRVKAAALNYRDVMLAEGLLPPDAEPATPTGPLLGLECAGIVTATGPDVAEWSVGDRLFAFAHGALGSHVRVRTEQAGRMPEHMTFEQAATLPAVFLTVQHSLETLAHLQADETVLVHGGAGGIGLAALAYARHIGARVIATAGTPAKRDLLRTLGAEAVFNSRDLSFAHQVRDATAGRGVDVVLNSLAGEAIARSLECLTPGGRFVELGKRDIYANAPLLLRPFRDNLAYYGVDITRFIADAPEGAAAAFRTVSERVGAGVYRALPHQTHPASRIKDAFSALRHSRHLGKVVISFTDSSPVVIDQPEPAVRLDPDVTYLITGGLSGLGAATARHLADRGARHLALLSRRGVQAPEAAGLMADLERAGTTVRVYGADVTEPEAVEAVIAEADQLRRPVRGVVHAAMHLDDAPLSDLTAERFADVLAPKVRGGSVLHDLTRDRALDFFVVYSSVAALIGNQHQAPYAAANLYLEALARQRRDHGGPGLALAWGGISETGYVARTQMADTIARTGIGLISPATALAAFDRHLHRAHGQAAIGVMDWDRLTGLLPALSVARFTAQLTHAHSRASRAQADDLRKRLKSAGSDQARLDLVTEVLVDVAARILQTTTDRVDPTANLADLGLDSLMGAELSVSLQQTFHCELSMMELMAAATLEGIAHRIHRTLHH
ncbi:type I polyketide synthase [Streptomyces sp. NBRC 110035]|uniref:type I polyketide synthase n=1 Tax=Streptomyces sp. NBRC 110035 TaxID=1547867 RepID=UPI0005A5EB21|nr:type I polyketide synthase [Streptomyces sp. NBRC 110035]